MLESYEGPEATDDVSVGWNKLFMAVSFQLGRMHVAYAQRTNVLISLLNR